MSHDDYCGSASELVPSGLRVYRHYRLKDAHFAATITTDAPISPGVNSAVCYVNSGGNPFRPNYGINGCVKCGGYGFLRKVRHKNVSFGDYMKSLNNESPIADVEVYEETCVCQRSQRTCRAPEFYCTCGFYASYDPGLNFFADAIQNGFGWMYDLPTVFAVVEASGRVLMGSKGVRAEKMEVKAVALDMKHVLHRARAKQLSGLPSADDYVARIIDAAAAERADGRRLYELEIVAERYGVPSFGDDIDAMVEAFPQPDLSGLIKNQEK